MKSQHHISTKDFEDYFDDFKEESERDHKWLVLAALLLGSSFVLESLKPRGSRGRLFLSKPFNIKDISDAVFRDILKMNVNFDDYYRYIFSEKDLARFRQLSEELRHHGRLEDPRTVENTAMRWMKQRNKVLGEFGSAESYRHGALNVYTNSGLVLKIPWSATGPRPCGTCRSLDGILFSPEEFPGPPHFHCLCNVPMANPVWVL